MFYLLAVLTSSTIVDYFDNDNDNHRFHPFSTKHSPFPRRCFYQALHVSNMVHKPNVAIFGHFRSP